LAIVQVCGNYTAARRPRQTGRQAAAVMFR
jgi:hypothetical protein